MLVRMTASVSPRHAVAAKTSFQTKQKKECKKEEEKGIFQCRKKYQNYSNLLSKRPDELSWTITSRRLSRKQSQERTSLHIFNYPL
jgi:hypothetical protein